MRMISNKGMNNEWGMEINLMNEETIEVKVLKESSLCEIFEEYDQDHIERCSDCGSSIFRIYNEPVKEGQYEQLVCAVCGHRVGGWLNDFNAPISGGKTVAGRICRKCGEELEV